MVLVEVLVVLVLRLIVAEVVVPPWARAAAVAAGCLPLAVAASPEAAVAAVVPPAVVAAVAVPVLQRPLVPFPFFPHGLPVLAGAMQMPQPVWLPSIGHPG